MKRIDIDNYPWIKTLDQYLIGHDGFVAGGCFKNLVQKQPVKDIDIFFYRLSDYDKAFDYHKRKTETYKFLYESTKATCFFHLNNEVRIDLVKSLFGPSDFVVNSFDFTIAKAYYKYWTKSVGEDEWEYHRTFVVHEDFFEHLLTKRLVVDDKMLYPGSTLERILRYGKQGYQPCRGTKIKLLEGIHREVSDLYAGKIQNIEDLLTASLYNGVD